MKFCSIFLKKNIGLVWFVWLVCVFFRRDVFSFLSGSSGWSNPRMRAGSPSRGRIRAKKNRRDGSISFSKMQRPQLSNKELIRSQKRLKFIFCLSNFTRSRIHLSGPKSCIFRNSKLETLLARVEKFIAGKHDNLEIATAHHKRCTVLSSLGRFLCIRLLTRLYKCIFVRVL